jgi:signal transduction histidine kinase
MRLPTLLRTGVFQLTLMYMALFGLSVAALFLLIYWTTVGSIERQADAVIQAEIQGLAEQYNQRGLQGLIEVIRQRARRDVEGRSIYLLADAGLRPLAGNLAFWPRQFDTRDEWVNFVKTDSTGTETPARGLVLQFGAGFRLMVGRENTELGQINQIFQRASIWGIGLTMGLALIGGLVMGQQAQRKVARLNRTTRQIIAGDLSQRVPTTESRDEYEDLANNVNAMLDQIENLLDGVRHVGDSIAHDLRGPLTRLVNQLEMLASEDQPRREGLEQCARQAEALLGTFNALLRIARVESGVYRSAFARLDVTEIVRDVCELYQAAAEEHQISLKCHTEPDVSAFGDRELLAQALTNLLDNAMKYAPAGGRIDVRLSRIGDRLRISVADSGPGIPPEDRERVLERFARLDRSRSQPGNGLGLALVKAVAEQHNGHLSLADNRPGLIVSLELPITKLTPFQRGVAGASRALNPDAEP